MYQNAKSKTLNKTNRCRRDCKTSSQTSNLSQINARLRQRLCMLQLSNRFMCSWEWRVILTRVCCILSCLAFWRLFTPFATHNTCVIYAIRKSFTRFSFVDALKDPATILAYVSFFLLVLSCSNFVVAWDKRCLCVFYVVYTQ